MRATHNFRTDRRLARKMAAAVVFLGFLGGACASEPPPVPPAKDGGFDPDLGQQPSEAVYAERGPFAVGVTTVEVEPGRDMEIWYPASPASAVGLAPEVYHIRDFLSPELSALLAPNVNPPFVTGAVRALPVSTAGPFPLVLFSHGTMSYRSQSSTLTSHLASWGFVVMSPDYFERGLQSLLGTAPAPAKSNAAITDLAMTAIEAANASGPLAGAIDTSRLFPIGHSAGGFQSTELAGTRTDVQSWIVLSAGVNLTPTIFNPSPKVPAALGNASKNVMWLTGEIDGVAQLPSVENGYRYSAGERKIVVISGAGHNNAVTDICEIGRPEGGLIGLAQSGGLFLPDSVINLAQNGCIVPPNKLSPDVWPITHHFVTAELRYRSGLDPVPVGLGSGVVSAFAPGAVTYRHEE